jgi:23S rRNA pseudouridine1911/1915/1917 synthase
MNPIITVLHEDNHVLGVLKPAGLLAQGDRTGDPTALAQVREYIRVTYGKPGEAFVGLVHRIDRPVSGVMVFARTSKAASRLARAFHDRTVCSSRTTWSRTRSWVRRSTTRAWWRLRAITTT